MKTEKLPVRLTEPELRARGDELAEKVRDRRLLDEQRKDTARDYRERLEVMDEQIGELARAVRDRTEDREVNIREEPDFKRGVMQIVRLDTGETVRERVLEEGERQGNLLDLDRVREGR